MQYLNKRKIILASGSARRKQILEAAGFDIEVRSMDVDESFPATLPPHEVPVYIAEKKVNAAIERLSLQTEIIVAADTIVVLGEKIYGKPVDENEAYHMLAHLSGKKHLVYTGVCLADKSQTIKFTAKAEVYFRPFTHEEILWYIKEFKPMDKAGAYAIQDWIGLCKISNIDGTQANIMGLPGDLVYEGLRQFEDALIF